MSKQRTLLFCRGIDASKERYGFEKRGKRYQKQQQKQMTLSNESRAFRIDDAVG